MWTAKRSLIFAAALLVAVSGYTTYYTFLGIIDGLRALPEPYLPDPNPKNSGPRETRQQPPQQDVKLEQGFGAGSQELQRPLRLWLPDKGVAFSAGDFALDKAGRVRLAPFSAAFFHKTKKPGEYPEISTIKCDVAILTLDQPATSFSDLNNRKVIAVEMMGKRPGIVLTNNRRTAGKHDDIDVLVTNGNLIYEERRNMIWTPGVVCLTDHQSRPPTVIRGTGMEMNLAKDSGPNAKRVPRPRPAQSGSEAGSVEVIRLKADVQMHFWVDSRAGFLGGAQDGKKVVLPAPSPLAGRKAIPPEKAQIHIRTGGPFVYDLIKEFAWFESPPTRESKTGKGHADPVAPDQVHVERLQNTRGKETLDQLICDRLELQFRRKVNPQAPAGNTVNTGGDKEIETAHATKRGGNFVTVALESEKTEAYGAELLYRVGDNTTGPMTILKGDPQRPLRAGKDGHKLVCKELHLFAANSVGEGQRFWAKGPGQIDLLDTKHGDKHAYPTHVLWKDTLDVVTEKEGGQVFDLMKVVGEASFIDDLQKQELHGDQIFVWVRQLQESAKKVNAVGGGKHELHRVIAKNKVRARSPEFIIREASQLTMIFLPELARNERLPDTIITKSPADRPKGPAVIPQNTPGSLQKEEIIPRNVAVPVEGKKPRQPIELQAIDITATISTLGTKKQLQELVAEGNVYVFQAGEKQGEKGIDITGRLLTVKQTDRGATLVVYGEKDKLARLEVGDSIIVGPRVTVNQPENRADVEGQGAMEMPTNKNLDGTETSKKNTRIRIYWKKNMTFDGKYAMFQGGVQAHEIGAHSYVLCEVLHTILDRTVIFKEGGKENQKAKIDRLIFDKNVFVDDAKVDEKKKLVQHARAQARLLVNLQDGPTRMTGPGEVRILAKGSAQTELAPPVGPGKGTAPKALEWKLTHVKFRDSMMATTNPGSKTATFYGKNEGVEVFHFPTIKIDDKMDADRPPKDGLYLRCEILNVDSRQRGDRTVQTMIAKKNVNFKTDQYFGQADIVKFDESTDIVILEGLNGRDVQLFQWVNGTAQRATVQTTKVLYNRRTGELKTDGVKSLTN
ncbi:MAG: hypothetical protein HYX68_23665 [Planctomycetes bacterium]|nr:hypothetical protein [Planctomycetota bacterium]